MSRTVPYLERLVAGDAVSPTPQRANLQRLDYPRATDSGWPKSSLPHRNRDGLWAWLETGHEIVAGKAGLGRM